MEIRRTALIGRSAARTFDVIEAAERYPEFLPWCAQAVILARDDRMVAARITVDYRGVRFAFTTRNPKARPQWLRVQLQEGPFRRFEGEWRLRELAPHACKIEIDFRYEFGSTLAGKLAAPVFDGITDKLVDAFVRRVEQQPPEAGPPVDSQGNQGVSL